MNISLLAPQGKVSRKNFTLWGLILFAVKYNIDRLIAITHERTWFITDYFMQADHLAINNLTDDDKKFYLILVAASIPFVWLGVVLCFKRLRDAGLPSWLVCMFFIPFINILFFFLLCVLPGKSSDASSDTKPHFLNKIIPRSETGSIFFAIVITLVVALIFSVLSVNVLGEYGWGLFIGIPFFIGFCSVLLYAYHHQPVSGGKAVIIGITSISIFALLIFGLAMEGAICIIMAAPFAYPIGIIGSVVACAIQSHSPKASLNCIAIYIFLLPVLMLTEQHENTEAPVYKLTTGLVVNEPPQKVWDHLVNFNTIPPPEELLFKTGIAYPVDAVIEGKGVGAIRKCNFTTGSFIEPITTWDEPHLLKFDVLKQPQPMFELSIYNNVQTIHLDGYFNSIRGQFKLVPINNHQTSLEGTTWYKNKMWPAAYWKQWSDFILHQIHYRVLKHIKQTAEINS